MKIWAWCTKDDLDCDAVSACHIEPGWAKARGEWFHADNIVLCKSVAEDLFGADKVPDDVRDLLRATMPRPTKTVMYRWEDE